MIVSHLNGKRKIYTSEKYKLLKGAKFAAIISTAIGLMLLMCGMAAIENHPIMPLQLVFLLGIGLFVLISLIYSYVSDKESCEKQSAAEVRSHFNGRKEKTK